MTEQEKKEIDPFYCAKTLQHILNKFLYKLSYAETAGITGAIAILFDETDMEKWDKTTPDIEKMFWEEEEKHD